MVISNVKKLGLREVRNLVESPDYRTGLNSDLSHFISLL